MLFLYFFLYFFVFFFVIFFLLNCKLITQEAHTIKKKKTRETLKDECVSYAHQKMPYLKWILKIAFSVHTKKKIHRSLSLKNTVRTNKATTKPDHTHFFYQNNLALSFPDKFFFTTHFCFCVVFLIFIFHLFFFFFFFFFASLDLHQDLSNGDALDTKKHCFLSTQMKCAETPQKKSFKHKENMNKKYKRF